MSLREKVHLFSGNSSTNTVSSFTLIGTKLHGSLEEIIRNWFRNYGPINLRVTKSNWIVLDLFDSQRF